MIAALLLSTLLTPVAETAVARVDVEQGVPFDQTHAAWTRVLEAHLHGERLDYLALSLARGPLDEYLLQLRGVRADDFATWTREQRRAFWINAYNAFTVERVLSRYPLKSLDEAGSEREPVQDQEVVPLGHLLGGAEAEKVSLNAIEEHLLGARFEDARACAALCPAALGGPVLRPEAYRADVLSRQLDTQVRAWLSDRRFTRFDREAHRVRLSPVLVRHEGELVRDAGSVAAWLARFAPDDEAAWLRTAEELDVVAMPNDRALNDVERDGR